MGKSLVDGNEDRKSVAACLKLTPDLNVGITFNSSITGMYLDLALGTCLNDVNHRS